MTKLTITGKRELDAAVAEHVMGWHLDAGKWCDSDQQFMAFHHSYMPTKDMNQAMEVVQRINENSMFITLVLQDCGTQVRLNLHDCYDSILIGQFVCENKGSLANRTAMQICIAALKAKGFEVCGG